MMSGMKETQLLCADNWDSQKKVDLYICQHASISESPVFLLNDSVVGAEVLMADQLKYVDRSLPFFLDDLDCNGSESNLLKCLPKHNCELGMTDESAGVSCLRKGRLS